MFLVTHTHVIMTRSQSGSSLNHSWIIYGSAMRILAKCLFVAWTVESPALKILRVNIDKQFNSFCISSVAESHAPDNSMEIDTGPKIVQMPQSVPPGKVGAKYRSQHICISGSLLNRVV